MRRLIAITQVSLDGVMQGPGGPAEDPSGGFTGGGWAMPFLDGASRRAIDDAFAGEFGLLLGRRTYEIWTGYWPHHTDDPIGAAFAKATKHVATRGQGALGWGPAQRIGPDAVAGVRRLKATAGPELRLWGSSELLQALVAADLVDEYRLWVFPVVLGQGKRLFGEGVPPRALALVSTRRTPTGVLLNTYRPAGRIPTA